MKAMILAAGQGVRMRPLTDSMPKPLLPINGKALIVYLIEALSEQGIRDIVINYSDQSEQLMTQLGDGRDFDVGITYSYEGQQGLETAGGIFHALPLLGDGPFMVINGDIWTDYAFSKLPTQIKGHAHLVLVNNPSHHPQGDFYLEQNQLVDQGETKLTFSGIGVYSAQLFAHCQPGKQPLAPLLREAIKAGRVSGEHFAGQWQDVGTPQSLEQLNQQFSSVSMR